MEQTVLTKLIEIFDGLPDDGKSAEAVESLQADHPDQAPEIGFMHECFNESRDVEECYERLINGERGDEGVEESKGQEISRETGVAPQGKHVEEIKHGRELEEIIDGLEPGQYAVITFSKTRCAPCKLFEPVFETFYQEAPENYVFLHTENTGIAWGYSISTFPTVVIFDGEGNTYKVSNANREQLLEELHKFERLYEPHEE